MGEMVERRVKDRRDTDNMRVEAFLNAFTPKDQERRSGRDRRRSTTPGGRKD